MMNYTFWPLLTAILFRSPCMNSCVDSKVCVYNHVLFSYLNMYVCISVGSGYVSVRRALPVSLHVHGRRGSCFLFIGSSASVSKRGCGPGLRYSPYSVPSVPDISTVFTAAVPPMDSEGRRFSGSGPWDHQPPRPVRYHFLLRSLLRERVQQRVTEHPAPGPRTRVQTGQSAQRVSVDTSRRGETPNALGKTNKHVCCALLN